MSAETQLDRRLAAQPARGSRRWLRLRARVAWRFLTARFSSSLTRRIVVLNLGGLVVLVVGFLLLDQFRADLIEARIQSLTIQADIIAAAISASATGDTDSITIDPDKLLQLAPGESVAPSQSDEDATQFSINPALVGPFLRRLVTPTHTRARIYDSDGRLLLDSRSFSARGAVVRSDLPDASDRSGFADRVIARLRGIFLTSVAPRADDPWATNGKTMPEVAGALQGKTQSLVRVNDEGETIVSVGVPIQRMMATRGALQLSTQGGDIDRVITSARLAQLRFFLVLAVVMLVLSLSLANTIAEPVRRLADAAERVRRGIRSRQQIPDFTARSDEIGHLSRALRDMTQALYNRLDAIESFAADVAHELKNPLTSLRSALETLPRVNAGHSRDRLIAVMQHDVRRLDRLISDISDASRLDAELARDEAGPVDVAALLRAVVAMAEDSPRSNGARVELSVPVRRGRNASADYFVLGHDSRLAQVVTNLIDNACSFSEPGGVVRVALERASARTEPEGEKPFDRVVITVDDDGPGIPPHALERIFERFYTDRPNQGFGQNSGLGLSISRQIVEAHGGRIWACNRPAHSAGVRVGRTGTRQSRRAGKARRGRSLCRRTAGVRGMSGAAVAGGAGLHATAVIHGESGVLILGPSGSGKSALALALMARASGAGAFGALIGDDRIYVRKADGRLVASGAANMAGIIERRMAGLIEVRHERAAIVQLAVELSERRGQWPRMPDDHDGVIVGGVRLPRLALDSGLSVCDQALAVEERLAVLAAENSGRIRISLEHCAAVHKNGRPEISPPA